MTVGRISVVCWIVFGDVYSYRLEVSWPGRAAYQSDVRICASEYLKGSTVTVFAHPRNLKRVAIASVSGPVSDLDIQDEIPRDR